jgi:hypothetical protein
VSNFDADPDPHLCLKDPDPTPDPNPLFRDFKDPKKLTFSPFFSYNLPVTHRHIIFSLQTNFLQTFCVKVLFCKSYFRKGKDPDPEQDSYGTSDL